MATPGGRIAPAILQGWLASLTPVPSLAMTPTWAALVTSDPFESSDPLTTEILGDAYRRPPFIYELVGTALRNQNELDFAGIAALSRVVGVAGFDGVYNGALLWYTPLPGDPLEFSAGGSLTFPARELYVSIDC